MLFEPQRRDIDCTTATYTDIMLTGFNTHRANHSGPDLTWNDTLASAAQTTTTTGVPGVHDKQVPPQHDQYPLRYALCGILFVQQRQMLIMICAVTAQAGARTSITTEAPVTTLPATPSTRGTTANSRITTHLRRCCTDRYRSNASGLRPSASHTRRGLWPLHANCMAGMFACLVGQGRIWSHLQVDIH